MSLLDFMRAFQRAVTIPAPEPAPPPNRFTPIEEMSDAALFAARLQMREGERPVSLPGQGVFSAQGSPDSMPTPEPDPRDGWRPSVFGAPSGESFPWPGR